MISENYSDELLAAMADDRFNSNCPDEVGEAAYNFVKAFGHCRITGVKIDADCETPMPVSIMQLACSHVSKEVKNVFNLLENFLIEDSQNRLDGIIKIIEARLDLWAATIGITSNIRACKDAGVDLDDFSSSKELNDAFDDIADLDEQLQLNAKKMVEICDDSIFYIWQNMLSSAYKRNPPWFLVGSYYA